jgi:uncharacterized membrane protein (DUF373 family)
VLEAILAKTQRFIVWALSIMLMLVVVLSTAHLAVLIAEEIWKTPRFLISVESLLDVFGYFLLVLIGVELLETLKGYLNKDTLHVRVVLEVALIAMARKAIIQEPNAVSPLTLLGFAAMILALAVAFYFERNSDKPNGESHPPTE